MKQYGVQWDSTASVEECDSERQAQKYVKEWLAYGLKVQVVVREVGAWRPNDVA